MILTILESGGQASDAGNSATSEMSDVAEDAELNDDAYSAVSSRA